MMERTIQTIKKMWKKAEESKEDKHLALLAYRNTPIDDQGQLPAQMLIFRRLRDGLIRKEAKLRPQIQRKRNWKKQGQEPQKEQTFQKGEALWFWRKNLKTEG
uniref:Uncharacterized protein n=1 Tax=Callorhinchus milii TaxID=7868 RepID=V9LD47_CALMI